MQFSDIGYIIKAQPHAESSVILTILTSKNGKVTGYVKNGLSKKKLGIYQIGNSVNLNAYSRLEESMYFQEQRLEALNEALVQQQAAEGCNGIGMIEFELV